MPANSNSVSAAELTAFLPPDRAADIAPFYSTKRSAQLLSFAAAFYSAILCAQPAASRAAQRCSLCTALVYSYRAPNQAAQQSAVQLPFGYAIDSTQY